MVSDGKLGQGVTIYVVNKHEMTIDQIQSKNESHIKQALAKPNSTRASF